MLQLREAWLGGLSKLHYQSLFTIGLGCCLYATLTMSGGRSRECFKTRHCLSTTQSYNSMLPEIYVVSSDVPAPSVRVYPEWLYGLSTCLQSSGSHVMIQSAILKWFQIVVRNMQIPLSPFLRVTLLNAFGVISPQYGTWGCFSTRVPDVLISPT